MTKIYMFRDDTLTIERLDGNRLYLDSMTQFRIYNFTTQYNIYMIYFYIFNIYSMIGNNRDWHGEIR